MPDANGKLTDDEKEKIKQFLTERNALKPCEACGEPRWTLGDHIISANIHTGGGLTVGGPLYPQVQLICENCFNTRLHMAVPIGVAGKGKADG